MSRARTGRRASTVPSVDANHAHAGAVHSAAGSRRQQQWWCGGRNAWWCGRHGSRAHRQEGVAQTRSVQNGQVASREVLAPANRVQVYNAAGTLRGRKCRKRSSDAARAVAAFCSQREQKVMKPNARDACPSRNGRSYRQNAVQPKEYIVHSSPTSATSLTGAHSAA